MYQINVSRPASGDPFFNTTSNGGYSQCIQGSPVVSGLNVLCNCVGASCGLFNKIYSEITGYKGMKYPYFNCNAENFITRNNQYYGLKVVQEPVEGGIMVWEGIGSLAGHVAVVGKCIDKNTVYTGESGYGSFAWANYTRRNTNGRWGLSSSYRYLGCIVNPAVGEQRSYTQPTPTPSKSIDEVAQEVIRGDWGNQPERQQRLEAAGYNYSEVQARVNAILAGNQPAPAPAPSYDLLTAVKKTIRGDYGNGQSRKDALGEHYSEVQRQVNLNIQHGTTQWDNIKLY